MTTLIQAFARARRAFLVLLLAFAALGAHAQITVDLSVSPFSGGVVAQGEGVPIRVTVSNSSGLSFTNITFNINSTTNVQLIGGFSGGTCTPPPTVLPVNPQRVAVTVPALGPNASCQFIVDSNSLAPGAVTLDAPAGGQVTAGGFENYLITGLPALQVQNTNSGDPNSLDTTIRYLLDHCTGSDVITFNIPGAGPHQIDQISSLPAINCAGTTIDGYTQPGSAPNTNTGLGSNATIKIAINGSSCSFCGTGLFLQAANITVRGLAIGGFSNNGISVFGSGVVIRGNFLGTDASGTVGVRNGLSSVSGTSDFGTIGGPSPADRNLITGSNAYGTSFAGSNVLYENNAIGGDRNGTAAIRNNAEGIYLTSGSHQIRNNVIAFNGTSGVTLATSAQATLDSNFITTNSGAGVSVQTDANTLTNNQIGGLSTGIDIAGSFNDVVGGQIEMNSADGITINGNENLVAGVQIQANAGAGIRVASGNDNTLTANAITGNGSSGIVLGAGAGGAPNDEASPPYDQDSGPNGLANRPVITSVQTVSGESTFISGSVKTLPEQPVRIEFFSNGTPQTVGNGATHIGSAVGSTDSAGLFNFFFNVSGVFDHVTATSTVDRCGDGCEETSEFSFPSVAAVPSSGAVITASPSTLTFGPQPVGTFSPQQTSTLTNAGPGGVNISSITGTGDFQFVTDCGAVLPQGMSCFIDAQFHPLVTGVRNGTITIVSDAAASPLTISLTGTGSAGPRSAIALQPDALVFEAVELGERSGPQAIRLINSGTADLNLRGFDTVGDFTILRPEPFREGQDRGKAGRKASRIVTEPPFTTCRDYVYAGEDCLIVIEFEPTARGQRDGLLIVESDAPTPSVTARLTGNGGTGPTNALEIASVLDFGAQFFGARSVGRELSIRNVSSQRAVLIDVVVDGDYTVGDTCREIAAGEACALTVFFKPTNLGLRTGTLLLRNQTEGAAYLVELRGIGAPNPTPLLSLSVTAIGFGTATGPRSSIVRVTNEGQQPITFNLVSATGDFMAISRCGTTLAVGGTCDIDVTFFSQLTGLRTGFLRLDTNAQGSPHLVELSAVGCRAPSAAFGRVRPMLCATGN